MADLCPGCGNDFDECACGPGNAVRDSEWHCRNKIEKKSEPFSMSEHLPFVVNDPPTHGTTTEWVQQQLQHALEKRDENNRLRIANLSSKYDAAFYHKEWCRWSDLVEHYEIELFRREHHKNTRDWEEDFFHENGQYHNECCTCHQKFLGHKRRVVCKLCYGESVEKLQADSMDRLNHSG